MKPALSFRSPDLPKSWQELPNGELIVKNIDQVLSNWWPKFFGYHLLKLGALSAEIDSSTSLIKHQLTLCNQASSANIVAEGENASDALPLARFLPNSLPTFPGA